MQGLRIDYRGDLGYAGSDHRAQLILFDDATPQPRRSSAQGWSWKMMDRIMVKAEAGHLRSPGPLNNAREIDNAVDDLMEQLTRIADATTPRRKPNIGQGAPWWNPQVAAAKAAAKEAERRYRTTRSQRSWQKLKEACAEQSRSVWEAQTKCWRRTIAAASKNSSQLWSIERWARLRSYLPPEAAALPPLQREGDAEPTAHSHAEKETALAERFFPNQPADLEDLRRPGRSATGPPVEIPAQVTADDVAQVLRHAGVWKALSLYDCLLTGFFKACSTPLARILAKITTASFQVGYFL